MKWLMVGIIGLTMVFAASAQAQPPGSPGAKVTTAGKAQLSPVVKIGKKDAKKTKMTKKTRKATAGETEIKRVVR